MSTTCTRLRNKKVLAIDPGLRTGCKLAVIDETGICIKNDLLFVTGSVEKKQAAKLILENILKASECEIIAIGNGTGPSLSSLFGLAYDRCR